MRKRKKIINFCLVFILCFSFIAGVSKEDVNAVVSVSKVTDTTNIDSKYSFASRYIDGVTKLETFGKASYDEDVWINEKRYSFI